MRVWLPAVHLKTLNPRAYSVRHEMSGLVSRTLIFKVCRIIASLSIFKGFWLVYEDPTLGTRRLVWVAQGTLDEAVAASLSR